LDLLRSGQDTGAIGTRTGLRFLYLGLGIAGLALWHKRRDPRFLPLCVGILALYACAHLGGFMPGMEQTQPYRQITPATMFTVLPAAMFVEELWQQRAFAGISRGTRT
jgi:peptidoglycan/LPS O-acetylase OafA/YrhL